MWFNLTDQLNKKIELIGTILRGKQLSLIIYRSTNFAIAKVVALNLIASIFV